MTSPTTGDAQLSLRQLRQFLVVAREGNMRRAAELLFISQPALSLSVQQLERELRVTLFERSARGVALTAAGTLFRERAQALLASAEAAVADVRGVAGIRPIRVGYLHSVGAELLTRVITGFEREFPAHAVEARSFDLSDPTAGVASGAADVAFTRSPVLDPELHHLDLATEQWAVCLPDSHPLASREEVAIEELLDEPVVAAPESAGSWRDHWMAAQARGGRPAIVAAVAATFEAEYLAVARGQGISFTTTEAARLFRPPGVRFIPVAGMEPARVTMTWRSDLPHVRRFVDFVRHQDLGSSASLIV
ncbi:MULTISPECIES: LysR family transcriptional regulator [unclassified Salinibacterium]|uniref:LysR family transcriptional regulator n=1 Tax=unclassified Salinibacterium TaxID=2632331 RepID=UPI00141FE296|nr:MULTISPECIES: LysR family transcriptional regulator [unclassified Salinibacterium]